MTPDIETVTALIEEVAATEILPRFEKLAVHEIREKSPGDVVTIADEAAEAWLTPRLTALLPGSMVLGEEAAAADPRILQRLDEADSLWLVDPVDGTANFAEGRPRFAVMVAYVHRGKVLSAWIHDPVNRRTAVAEQGSGAFINGRPLQVAAAPEAVREMSGTIHGSKFADKELAARVQARRHLVNAVKSLRCAGLEYIRLAAGDVDFSLFSSLWPWDHAPGVLLHAEAGGYASYLDGGAYDPARIRGGGLLLAPDAASWRGLYRLLIAPEDGR